MYFSVYVCVSPSQKGADSWTGWGWKADVGDCSPWGRVPPVDRGKPDTRHHVHGAHSAACNSASSQSEEAGFLMTFGLLCKGQNEHVWRFVFALWAIVTLGYDAMYI